MAVFKRAKRVTDPLNDEAKARLRGDDIRMTAGYASNGSEHEEADRSCFSNLVHAFLENDGPDSAAAGGDAEQNVESDSDSGDCSVESAEMLRCLLQISPKKDPYRLRLLLEVSEMGEALSSLKLGGSGCSRAVVARLRDSGYNAGLCKARWETCGGLIAGSYEYIDVITTKAGLEQRYIVDLDFAGQFEIARPTEEYTRIVNVLPRTFVGTTEEVRQVAWIMGDAAARSLRKRDMHVPPWRKTPYMLAKWLGPCRRTINSIPSSTSACIPGNADIRCAAVGLHTVQRFPVSPATRIT